MHFLRVFAALAAAACSVSASPLRQRASTTFLQPSLDAFYKAPANLSAYSAGQVIRERPVETDVTQTRSQTQLLYATVDAVGRQDVTVATVFAPAKVAAGSPKIFSLQSPQDAGAFDCAASFNLLKGSTSNATITGSILVRLEQGSLRGLCGAVAAFMKTYDDFNGYIRSILTPAGAKSIDFAQAYACVPQELKEFAFKDIFAFTTKSQSEILANPIVAKRLSENLLGAPGTPVIPYPQYIYSGILDEVISNKGVTAYVDEQCKLGARINYNRDLLAEHLTEQIQAFLPQFQWSVDALEGKTASVTGCQRKDNFVSLLPQLFTDYGNKLVGPDAIRKITALDKSSRR